MLMKRPGTQELALESVSMKTVAVWTGWKTEQIKMLVTSFWTKYFDIHDWRWRQKFCQNFNVSTWLLSTFIELRVPLLWLKLKLLKHFVIYGSKIKCFGKIAVKRQESRCNQREESSCENFKQWYQTWKQYKIDHKRENVSANKLKQSHLTECNIVVCFHVSLFTLKKKSVKSSENCNFTFRWTDFFLNSFFLISLSEIHIHFLWQRLLWLPVHKMY